MRPQIVFKHVLSELSVNRTDPCEVLRELISNSYDAKATKIWYVPLAHYSGFIFADNGEGLSTTEQRNGITPYEAFFSIGRSTKTKGSAIGYKCQGSKLLFASSRVLIITRAVGDVAWNWRGIENPRDTLSDTADIDPQATDKPWDILQEFCSTQDSESKLALSELGEAYFKKELAHGTFVCVQKFDADNFQRHFLVGQPNSMRESYVYNYLRHYTKHGETRAISLSQGFKNTQLAQVKANARAEMLVWNGASFSTLPSGFPYLDVSDEIDIKSPQEVSRLRDGRFFARYAKRVTSGGKQYSFLLCVDGNRRAHDMYAYLDRKGITKSGIRLTDQRGVCLSVNGVRVCRYTEIFSRPELSDYEVLGDSEAATHYLLMIDGPFDLVTNRNAVSRSSTLAMEDATFLAEVKTFLDQAKNNQSVFRELVARLRKEQSDAKLNQQMEIVNASKAEIRSRERFKVADELFVSPRGGEEYLVGVLYATLGSRVEADHEERPNWIKILTFSTLGIDSFGTLSGKLDAGSLVTVEYKYEFSLSGPFNHALATVNFIVAWTLNLKANKQIQDTYGCFGDVTEKSDGIYEISNIEHEDGASYPHTITVVDLKKLIGRSFASVNFSIPPTVKPHNS